MKKHALCIALLTSFSMTLHAKDICFKFPDSTPTNPAVYVKFKAVAVPKLGGATLSGIAVVPSPAGGAWTGYIRGQAVSLGDKTINYFLVSDGVIWGVDMAGTVAGDAINNGSFVTHVEHANPKTYIGTPAGDYDTLIPIPCTEMPIY